MPITTDDFFFVNFGYFFQVPLFEYLYSGLDINLKKQNSILVGNPDMKPQVTKAWEFSYRRQIRNDISLTVTLFDKETENLVDTKTFLASDSKSLDDGYHAQYVNSPYANAQGLEFTIEKHSAGLLFGRLSYTYMKAEGISEREQEGLSYLQWGFEPVNNLYPLSWDQRHTVSGVVGSNLPYDITADLIVNYHSPRPYTYFPSDDGFTPPGTVLPAEQQADDAQRLSRPESDKIFHVQFHGQDKLGLDVLRRRQESSRPAECPLDGVGRLDRRRVGRSFSVRHRAAHPARTPDFISLRKSAPGLHTAGERRVLALEKMARGGKTCCMFRFRCVSLCGIERLI